MNLEFMYKDPSSGNGDCPAVYKTDDGGRVFQGKKLTDEERAQLRNVAGDEDAVYLPPSLVAKIREGV